MQSDPVAQRSDQLDTYEHLAGLLHIADVYVRHLRSEELSSPTECPLSRGREALFGLLDALSRRLEQHVSPATPRVNSMFWDQAFSEENGQPPAGVTERQRGTEKANCWNSVGESGKTIAQALPDAVAEQANIDKSNVADEVAEGMRICEEDRELCGRDKQHSDEVGEPRTEPEGGRILKRKRPESEGEETEPDDVDSQSREDQRRSSEEVPEVGDEDDFTGDEPGTADARSEHSSGESEISDSSDQVTSGLQAPAKTGGTARQAQAAPRSKKRRKKYGNSAVGMINALATHIITSGPRMLKQASKSPNLIPAYFSDESPTALNAPVQNSSPSASNACNTGQDEHSSSVDGLPRDTASFCQGVINRGKTSAEHAFFCKLILARRQARLRDSEGDSITVSEGYDLFSEEFKQITTRWEYIKWIEEGRQLARLCEGGSIAMLFLLASAEISPTRIRKLTAKTCNTIAHGLYKPLLFDVNSMASKMIRDHILPALNAILKLGRRYEAKDHTFGLHLEQDTMWFRENFNFNFIKLADKRSTAWSDNHEPIPLALSGSPSVPPRHIVKLAYDSSHISNRPNASDLNQGNRINWTNNQRFHSERAAMRIKTIEDLPYISTLYRNGKRADQESYATITKDLMLPPDDGTVAPDIVFVDINGLWLATLRRDQRQRALCSGPRNVHLWETAAEIWPESFHEADPRQEAYAALQENRNEKPFPALHFQTWAGYLDRKCIQRAIKAGIHPFQARGNFHQLEPYVSQDTEWWPEAYDLINEKLHDVFQCVDESVRRDTPEEWKCLTAFLRSLPGGCEPPHAPFAGYALNACACTCAHIDVGDMKGICACIPFGDYTGGALILHQLGIRLETVPGTICIFNSSKLVHFNEYFEGNRGSIVLFSDARGENWNSKEKLIHGFLG